MVLMKNGSRSRDTRFQDEIGLFLGKQRLITHYLKKEVTMKVSGFASSFLIPFFSFAIAAGLVIPCGAQEARKSAAERRVILKNLIQKEKYIMVPGVYDAVSARLVEQAGFPVVYIGSYATAASQYGLPDDGMVNLTQMVDKARTVVNATNIPVIGDGENGFTFAANIWTTVQAFEQAGVSAIHIEDHEFGKHTDLPKVILPWSKW
jgi:hypothetical protein